MNGWSITRVWQIDGQLFIAPTIEKAIDLFRTYFGKDDGHEPTEIVGVHPSGSILKNYEAIIEEEYETGNTQDKKLLA